MARGQLCVILGSGDFGSLAQLHTCLIIQQASMDVFSGRGVTVGLGPFVLTRSKHEFESFPQHSTVVPTLSVCLTMLWLDVFICKMRLRKCITGLTLEGIRLSSPHRALV